MKNQNTKKLILRLLDELLLHYKLTPQIGFELEFYVTDLHGNQIDHFLVLNFQQQLLELNIKLEEEKGRGQFEVQCHYTKDLLSIINYFVSLKEALNKVAQEQGFLVNFTPKPFQDDYGSSLHVHLSINDENDINVFSLTDINQSSLLKRCIFGILDIINEGIYFFGEEKDFARFNGKFMSPINISWGGNNRSTAIRIPASLPEFRRIELRVPSASASLDKVIVFMLIGVLHGLREEGLYYERIYGNAFDKQYALQMLPKDLKEAKNIFHERATLKNYLELFQFNMREEEINE